MLRIFLALACLIGTFTFSVSAQNDAIGFNEKLTFTASYNMSGILTDLAQVTMETSPVKTSKATLLRLKCTATTYSKWDSFFKIRDLYESYVNPKTLTPYLYNRDINEGGYSKSMKYTYSHKTNTVKTVMKKKSHTENKTVSMGSGTKDIIATMYSIRLVDFESMSSGSSKTFPIIFDREAFKGQIKYLGKETISTALGSKSCYKISIWSSESGALKGTLWLTADANKIPVYGQFKIPVGTGELKIKSATGLKT